MILYFADYSFCSFLLFFLIICGCADDCNNVYDNDSYHDDEKDDSYCNNNNCVNSNRYADNVADNVDNLSMKIILICNSVFIDGSTLRCRLLLAGRRRSM